MNDACSCNGPRRRWLAGVAALFTAGRAAADAPAERAPFVAQAFEMRRRSIAAGDQAYGAVVVKDGRIIGFGPSRVVLKKDWTAHAEREAIREAQARLGRTDLSGCILYSSSRPCSECERAAAAANIDRMIFGSEATDAGRPRKP